MTLSPKAAMLERIQNVFRPHIQPRPHSSFEFSTWIYNTQFLTVVIVETWECAIASCWKACRYSLFDMLIVITPVHSTFCRTARSCFLFFRPCSCLVLPPVTSQRLVIVSVVPKIAYYKLGGMLNLTHSFVSISRYFQAFMLDILFRSILNQVLLLWHGGTL